MDKRSFMEKLDRTSKRYYVTPVSVASTFIRRHNKQRTKSAATARCLDYVRLQPSRDVHLYHPVDAFICAFDVLSEEPRVQTIDQHTTDLAGQRRGLHCGRQISCCQRTVD